MRKALAIGLAAMMAQGALAFTEINGVISMEAEHYLSKTGYNRYANGGASGGAVMRADGATGSSLNFEIEVAQGGTWYVWVRENATSSANNSFKLGLDGRLLTAPAGHPLAGTSDVYLRKNGWCWEPQWVRDLTHAGPVTAQLTAGRHVFSVIKRKSENPLIDKIVLTRSAQAPAGYGPAETTVSPLAISPAHLVIAAAGAAGGAIAVAPGGATQAWTAVSSAPDWLTLAAGAGTGTGTATYNVAVNAGAFRSAQIRISSGEQVRTCVVSQVASAFVPVAPVDFDGGGAADAATYGTATGAWSVQFSEGGGTNFPFGWAATRPVPGDYDGDGLLDAAVYHASGGKWYLRQSSGGTRVEAFGWGAAIPLPGDYDGDGVTDLAVFDRATARWHFRMSSTGRDSSVGFGWSATIPVPADYDGDGVTDLAVYHPAGATWYVAESSTGDVATRVRGGGRTLPVPADYDGDGAADAAVYSGGAWTITRSSDGADDVRSFGWAGAQPVPADYDGDGTADLAVYDPRGGKWYVLSSDGGATLEKTLGGAGQIPVLLNSLIHSWYGM